jgi:hypothetical protein
VYRRIVKPVREQQVADGTIGGKCQQQELRIDTWIANITERRQATHRNCDRAARLQR